jgi:uncharacterized protein YutE (UPF0331/DUF86 family)
MNPPRPPSTDPDLRERLDRTFVGLRRQFEQLELAFEPWRGEEGHWAFNAAFASADPAERNRTELVHANFERCHQLIRDSIELAGKLGERAEMLPKPSGKSEDRIRVMAREGILTAGDETLMREHVSVRNESQHAYVETAAKQVYEAAEAQLKHGPALVARIVKFAERLEDAGSGSAASRGPGR